MFYTATSSTNCTPHTQLLDQIFLTLDDETGPGPLFDKTIFNILRNISLGNGSLRGCKSFHVSMRSVLDTSARETIRLLATKLSGVFPAASFNLGFALPSNKRFTVATFPAWDACINAVDPNFVDPQLRSL